MTGFSRRNALVLGAGAVLSAASGLVVRTPAVSAEAMERLVLAGPPAPPTLYLAHLAGSEAMAAYAKSIEFKQWRTPDMLISQVMNGQIHVGGTPSNVAATLYNKGVGIRLLDITTWGVLHLLTRRDDIRGFRDLKGKAVQLFFRGGMPDIVLRYLAIKSGLDPDKDMSITYVTNPLQNMKMFMAGKVDTVLLPEPAVSAAKIRSKAAGKRLNHIDIQAVWKDVTGRSRIPQAGTLIQADLIDKNPELVAAVKSGIADSVRWMNTAPAETARLGAAQFGLKAPVILESLKHVHMERVPAAEAREDLEFFYAALMELSPKLVGGRLPDDRFYLE